MATTRRFATPSYWPSRPGRHHPPPDHRLTGEQQPDGSILVAAWTSFTGTHLGELYGYPATGRQVTVHGYRFFRVEDGLITDYWPLGDWHGLFGQLGFEVPVPAGAPTSPPRLEESL